MIEFLIGLTVGCLATAIVENFVFDELRIDLQQARLCEDHLLSDKRKNEYQIDELKSQLEHFKEQSKRCQTELAHQCDLAVMLKHKYSFLEKYLDDIARNIKEDLKDV